MTRAALCAAFALAAATSAGCAALAGLGGDGEDQGPGSNIPDRGPATPQLEGGPSPTPSCNADLTKDPDHCGWCGHACGGATCTAGLCTPTSIIAAEGIRNLVVDEDRVVFATEHEVRTCPAAPAASCPPLVDALAVRVATAAGGSPGGGTPTTLTPRGLALVDKRVFVLEERYDVVVVCPREGCAVTSIATVKIDGDSDFTGSVSVGGGRVEWGESDGIGEADVPPPGGHTDGRFVGGPLTDDVNRVQVSSLGGLGEVVFHAKGGVFSLPLKGPASAPIPVFASLGVQDFAMDARVVYAATKDTVVRIDRVTRASTPFTQLASAEITQLIGDDAGVYAATLAGHVVRVREGGVDDIAITTDLRAIAISTKWLYIASNGGIRRVAR